MTANYYIRMKADGTPVTHVATPLLPFDNSNNPLFIIGPKGNKSWYKPAILNEEEVGENQRKTGPFYEDLKEDTATIRFGAEDIVSEKQELKEHVDKIRDERMANGFQYDFEDARGVHLFGYTNKDRDGWQEVKSIADTAIQISNPTLEISIRTNTGDIDIEAQEWALINLAGAQALQPIWQASWVIKDAIDAEEITTLDEIENHPSWP